MKQLRQFLYENPSYHLYGVANTMLFSTRRCHLDRGLQYVTSGHKGGRGQGRGVSYFVHDKFKVTWLTCSVTKQDGKPGIAELLMCNIEHGQSPPMLVNVIYRPYHVPFSKDLALTDNLNALCDDLSTNVTMSHLNANLFTACDDAKLISKLMAEFSLQLTQYGATHHSPTSRT